LSFWGITNFIVGAISESYSQDYQMVQLSKFSDSHQHLIL